MAIWNQDSIHELVASQRSFFKTNATLDINWRIEQLKKLVNAMKKYEPELTKALHEDLGRDELEAYFCDVGTVILEANETIKGLKKWAKPETHFSGLVCFPSITTKVYKIPYGVSLIISPFNFPILLSLGVLIAAIAGGNTAIIKTSSKSTACTKITQKIISEIYPSNYVAVVDGGHDVADMCLDERFDKIFYTGSPKVGSHVLEKASKYLTPVALELGGETGNWCIIRKDADLLDAARKIAFFKICNSGQICININQIAVASEVSDAFVVLLKKEIIRQIGENPIENPEYPKLVNESAFNKCAKEAEEYSDRIVFGGVGDISTCKYSPTIIYPVDIDEPIVNHELFCPLLPIVKYNDNEIDSLLETIEDHEHGLSLYIFTKNVKWAKKTMQTLQFGGGCINEVCVHMMVKGAPFNGVGHSGMGAYHGKYGFMEFTHPSTVLKGSTHFNLALREHPYNGPKTSYKKKFIRLFEK